ncbi:MAG: aspartate/glutamate racemase family protein [Bacilli bacterium]
MNKKLGIIGGMGPLASAYLYKRIIELTNALKDQDHIPIIIDNKTEILDRTAFLTGKGKDPYPFIKESAIFLENSNVDAIIIACNTAHFCYEKLKKDVSIPIYHMIEEVVEEIKENPNLQEGLAILGTEGLRLFPSYKEKLNQAGIFCYETNLEEQNKVSEIIYLVKEEGVTKKVLEKFKSLINSLEKKNLKHFILGCTELPLIVENLDLNKKYISSIDVLAKRTIKKLGYPLKGEKE